MVLQRLARSVLSLAAHRLAHAVPRDDSLWAFGCRGGEGFEGNAKYLFLHVATRRDVRAVWLSKNEETVRELRRYGFEAHQTDTHSGKRTLLRAGTVFVTGSVTGVPLWPTGGARVIQLWHGVPLKRIGADAPRFDGRSLVDRLATLYTYRQFDVITVTAAQLQSYFADAFRTDADRPVTGYPRNDALFRQIPGERICQPADVHDEVAELNVAWTYAYVPTYREDGRSPADHIDVAALDAFLAERDAAMLVKFHPFDEPALDPDELDRIHVLPSEFDLYPALRHVDTLVTDYSSIYVDYLLTDRPVAFYAVDRDRYADESGFYLEYDDVTPGPVATTFDELLDALDSLRTNPDAYADERERVRDLVFDHADGHAAERVRRYAAEPGQTHVERIETAVGHSPR
ncbi:glycosyl/glycerophosphate transferase [Halovivax asiaticus JCM 14624]|uniref:Glycosyl/glycerophosphate transferase n=1 Tax=Halovivax asiaticus JCM 14624 TaxID=1227490 RepID=M0BSA5_9EURY|nr:CDP-glycerol glycerophosphotransferase family protein [Halovivax asiaticus]ELZ13891.1 glycosyl/glycerophosphate transferase [Halovivax asiaticus JCM 14624]